MPSLFEQSDVLNAPYEVFLYESSQNGLPVALHWHYFMEILYVIEGSVDVTAGGASYELTPGDLIVFHPQVRHRVDLPKTETLRFYCLKFDPVHLNISSSSLPQLSHLLWMVQNDSSLPCCFRKETLSGIPLRELFEKTKTVVERRGFGYDIQAHSLCCLLISELLTLWQEAGFRIDETNTQESKNDLFCSVAEYINRHYADDLQVEALAAHFGMSYSNFAARFRDYYGMSCRAYIQHIRVGKAEDLLRQTDLDLAWISRQTGFCDSSHFIRVFRRIRHMTPRQFRLQSREL